jgi:hypothetical protein
MKFLISTLLLLCLGLGANAQKSNKNNEYATIIFAGDKSKNSRTYIGKVKKGNPETLHGELQSAANYSGNTVTVSGGTGNDMESYIKYLSKHKKRIDKKKFRALSDIYNIDEDKLKARNERYYQKYLDEKQRVYSDEEKEKRKKKNSTTKSGKLLTYSQYVEAKSKAPQAKSYIARNYKIKTRRFWKWRKLKYPPGSTTITIVYKVREENTVRKYVSMASAHLGGGKTYELKYHGTNNRRNYYLEYRPDLD